MGVASKKKIGIVTLWFNRGQAYLSRQLTRALERAGHTVFIFARVGTAGGMSHLETSGEWAHPQLTPHTTYSVPPELLRYWIEKHGIEILILVEEQWQTGLPASIKNSTDVRLIGIPMQEYLDLCPEDPHGYRYYDKILCPVKIGETRLKKAGHANAVYLPWGVDLSEFEGEVNRGGGTVGPGLSPAGPIRFFHPAGWGGAFERRATDLAAGAFEQAHGVNPNIRLLIHRQAGFRGPVQNRYKGFIRVIDGNLPRADLLRLYKLSDVCLLPSKFEGLGLTFFEALGAGCPIVTVDHPPMNEHVSPGKTGLACRVDRFEKYDGVRTEAAIADVGDLAEKIFQIANGDLAHMRREVLKRRLELDWNEIGKLWAKEVAE